MAGIFSKLYKLITGQQAPHRAKTPGAHHHTVPKRAHIRQTAADEYQTRTKLQQGEHDVNSLKAKIAAENAKILEQLKKPWLADMERNRAESLKRQAEIERRIEADKPVNRFLAGTLVLTLNTDFRSTNPPKPAVYQVWYAPEMKAIFVKFWENGAPGRTYKYWPIDNREALEMYAASSKGVHIWDKFRVRGSRVMHKKHYVLVSA
jgi:hypothetical protein